MSKRAAIAQEPDPAREEARKGARRMADVTPETLARLNAGEIESVTLAEMLCVDFAVLLRVVSPKAAAKVPAPLAGGEGGLGITRRMEMVADALIEAHGADAIDLCASHRSDLVRGWGAYVIGRLDAGKGKPTLKQRLALVRPLADDANPGVREWAWIGMRPRLASALDEGFELLRPWTASASPNIRRYASEITRPRGVWCAHLDALKREPAGGLVLLEPLRADPTKYVQDSVANWLNDASKSEPAWVRSVCKRWLRESACRETERICRRALRSID